MRKCKRNLALVLIAPILACLLAGCTLLPGMSIKEDAVREHLPPIDPGAGVAREVQVKLYYRLTDEAYLVGVAGTVTVLANERPEKAMVRKLLSGVPPLANNISEVIPQNTKILDVSLAGGILYITLSNEFFHTAIVDEVIRGNKSYLESGFLSREEYDARVAAAREEMYLSRRLAVCSIVNTITEYDPGVRVHLLFDTDGSGIAARVPGSELGFARDEQAGSDLLDPLTFFADAVVSPATLVQCALERMMRGEYEKAYALFAETESGGMQKPTYANFETEMLSRGKITAYTLYSYQLSQEGDQAHVLADLEYTDPDGQQVALSGVSIALRGEGNLYKIGYHAFTALFVKEGA